MLSHEKQLAKLRGNRRAFKQHSKILHDVFMRKLQSGLKPAISLGWSGQAFVTFLNDDHWGRMYAADPNAKRLDTPVVRRVAAQHAEQRERLMKQSLNQ